MRILATAAVVALALVGCAPSTPPKIDPGTDPGGGKPAASGCDASKDDSYKLFSDPALSVHPENGFTFGDGSPATFVYDDTTKTDGGFGYGYDLSYIQDNGAVIVMGGAPFFGDNANGHFTTQDKVFESNADGRYGFFTVTLTVGKKTTTIGVFCTKFAVSK